ncbi:MAG: class I SAM-dependent methyltransferase [Gemmatimonadota bacterium]|nr:class I SAM-dependent methyltransferase [Gemmatimonadota bacterium]
MKRITAIAVVLVVGGAQAVLGQELRLELPDRTPAAVMSYRGAGWLERPERVAEEMPEEMLAVLGLEDGDVVADIGAGSGFYTRRMSRLVSPSGTVYAVDIQPEMIDILSDNIEQEGLANVTPVLSTAEDPGLPEGAIDWMLLVDVYHEFADPGVMLDRMSGALKADGRVALLEYRVEDGTGDHILAAHRMSVRQVMIEWTQAGFRLAELHEFLPGQHLFVFEKASLGAAGGQPIEHVDLLDAMSDGRVSVEVRGNDAESIRLAIQRTRAEAMVVTFPVGTYFNAPTGSSDMVALRDGMVLLTNDASHDWRVPARLAHPTATVPGAGDALEVQSADDHRRERNVLWVFQGLDFPPQIAPLLEQIALWIASVDAGYDDLAPHLRGAPLPPANGIALALAYVENAGIDVLDTRIWSERERYLPAISDPSLRALFDDWARQ